ncbi:MAG: type II toxin-antitoxin system prevent-host-death family antitoxin [Ardenticatenaceae bacterium]|nr:type II toxin-antitoxin system prevent-host-death family antitoxin [Anaerolineales bacterium]MCB8922268.1 type II toxin-antitoxin system prevent-host-death family antitoxin [Ardenticatenaceae bacterium]MCB8990547.1 type II toxin-antitoxin system prevent-host-death family antitoxin [Ardenticatenaceae bacterium]
MAQEIGIRELKNQTSNIVRQVREQAMEYVITHHGQPVAILRPIQANDTEALQKQKSLAAMENLLELGAKLAKGNPMAKSAVEILAEMREEESQWPL